MTSSLVASLTSRTTLLDFLSSSTFLSSSFGAPSALCRNGHLIFFVLKIQCFFWEIEAIFYLSAGTAAVALARKGHFSE